MSYYSEAIARHIVTHTAAEGKEEYQKFFKAALKKFGVSSPAGLSPDKKKDFFNYIEKGYKAKDESTKAFGKTIRKQDLRQQLSMISDKDKATLGKLAALMRGAKKKKPNEALTKEDIAIMVREAYIEENKVTCPKCEGKGCEHCDGKGYHMNEDNDAKIKAINKQIKQLQKQKEKDQEFMKKLTDLQMRNSQSNKIFRSAKKISDLRKKRDKMKENKGLWHNINAKKKRGEKSSPKGSKAYKQAKAAGQKINRKNEDVTLPAEIKRYMNKFVSALKGSGLNRRRQLVVLAGVIDALGVDEQMLMKLVRKIKKGMKDVG